MAAGTAGHAAILRDAPPQGGAPQDEVGVVCGLMTLAFAIGPRQAPSVIRIAHAHLRVVGAFLHRRVCGAVMAVALGRGHDPVGCQGPVPARTAIPRVVARPRSEEHTSELQSQSNLVCRLLLEKK